MGCPFCNLTLKMWEKLFMNHHILITYASCTGCTSEIAASLGASLREHGLAVDVKPVTDDPALDDYDFVLLGSAVQHGHWLPEAMNYIQMHQTELNQKPVVLFSVHIQNTGKDHASTESRMAYLNEVRDLVNAQDEVFFAGRFNRQGAKLLLPSWVARFVPTIDLRRWKQIKAYADHLALQLQQEKHDVLA